MEKLSDFIDDVLTEVSGKYAWDWVAKIIQYNRARGSKEFHEIVERVMQELNKYGLDEVKLHKYPADGKSKTWEWVSSPGWEVTSGELRMLEPKKEVICRFKDVPMCILGYSKSCEVSAEIIDVGTGSKDEEFEGKDVEGKILLMEAPKLIVPPLYAQKGALGIIVYPNPQKVSGFRGMTTYNRFPAKTDLLEKNTFGFSITYEQALSLKELLEDGAVKVHASIDAKIFDAELEVISAAIYGTERPQEEIILTAHLCHPAPGANDNASGSGGLIELARSLSNLIKNKVLSPPKRTIRFLWIPEFDGTWPWVKEHEEKAKNALINLNLDMIGEHPMKIGEPCQISLAPYSRPSILNDVLRYFTEIIADHPKGVAVNGSIVPMRYRIFPFSGGSDQQVFVDSVIGIPGMMFGHNDPLWHTSLDTIEQCDPTEMQRVIGIALCTGYLFATLDGNLLIKCWPFIEESFYLRLGKAKKVLLDLYNTISKSGDKNGLEKEEIPKGEKGLLGIAIIESANLYEKEILESMKKFEPLSMLTHELISRRIDEINRYNDNLKSLWSNLCDNVRLNLESLEEPEMLKSEYALAFKGLKNLVDLYPIAMSRQFEKIKVPKELWFGDLHEMMNLVGRSHDLKTICAMLTIEYQHYFFPSQVHKFMKFLIRKSIINKA
jgi:hypothetical protein